MKQIEAIDFPEANFTFTPPDGLSAEDCGNLRCYHDGFSRIVTCWKIPFWSRVKLFFTGRLWMGVMSNVASPTWFTTKKPLRATKEGKK